MHCAKEGSGFLSRFSSHVPIKHFSKSEKSTSYLGTLVVQMASGFLVNALV